MFELNIYVKNTNKYWYLSENCLTSIANGYLKFIYFETIKIVT